MHPADPVHPQFQKSILAESDGLPGDICCHPDDAGVSTSGCRSQQNANPGTLHGFISGSSDSTQALKQCGLLVQPPAGHDLLRWGIFQAIGIFALSVSGHSSLPVLRNSMGRPQVS